ncbi:MAG: hypothetical protein ACRBBW_15160 [Cellvibrionaceae bacterium]
MSKHIRSQNKARTHSRVDKRLFLLGFLLLALVASSFLALLADINAHQATRLERRWEQSGSVPNLSQLMAARASLEFAEQLSFDHPDYLQALGRLSSWHFFVEGVAPSDVETRKGLTSFRAALTVRPYWAYGWSELLLLKAQLGEVDEEFSSAFDAVLSTGVSEPKALLNLVNAGLGSWSLLEEDQQIKTHKAFLRLLGFSNQQSRTAIAIATQHGQKAAMCDGLDEQLVKPWVIRSCKAK